MLKSLCFVCNEVFQSKRPRIACSRRCYNKSLKMKKENGVHTKALVIEEDCLPMREARGSGPCYICESETDSRSEICDRCENAIKRSGFHKASRRAKVWVQDKGKCYICLRPVSFSQFEIEHVVPKSKGGSDAMHNLRCSCHRCNKVKMASNRSIQSLRKMAMERMKNDAEWDAIKAIFECNREEIADQGGLLPIPDSPDHASIEKAPETLPGPTI